MVYYIRILGGVVVGIGCTLARDDMVSGQAKFFFNSPWSLIVLGGFFLISTYRKGE